MNIKLSILISLLFSIAAQAMSQQEYEGHHRNNCSFVGQEMAKLATSTGTCYPSDEARFKRLVECYVAMKCPHAASPEKEFKKNEQSDK